jgi:LysR family nitrogen assimilation transcriptional regulator
MRLLGSDMLVAARQYMPDVFLSLVEEQSFVLVEALERGELDLALVFAANELPGLEREPLIVEELLLITRADLAPAQGTVPFRDAAAMDLVLINERDMIRRMVEAEARRQAVPLKVIYEVQSLQATQQVVLEGLAASILPFGTVAMELRSGKLASRRIAEPRLHRQLYLARAATKGHLANEDGLRDFIGWVVSRLAESLGPLCQLVRPFAEPASPKYGTSPASTDGKARPAPPGARKALAGGGGAETSQARGGSAKSRRTNSRRPSGALR